MLTNPTSQIKTLERDRELKLDDNYSHSIEYEIKPAGKLSLNLKELWNYKELFYYFTWRDIKVKYKQAYLGIAWVLLQPLLMMTMFSIFFGRLVNVSIPYPIFVYSGMMFWNLFSAGLSSSGDSMVSNSGIIKKIYFPRLIIPCSAIIVSMVDFTITFCLFVCLLLFYQHEINLINFMLLFPLGFIMTVLTTFGMGTLLSSLNVKFRDFRYVIPFLIQSTLFVTPVIYPISILNYPWAKYLLALNPLTGAITLGRAAIIDNPIDWNIVLISLTMSIIIAIAGLLTFRKMEAYFADIA